MEERKRELKESIDKLNYKIQQSKDPYDAGTYKCDWPEFSYLVQDLCNKSLLIDRGIDAPPFELVEITQLGIDLIDRLRE